jgi:Cu/Ag efflux pump CusA
VIKQLDELAQRFPAGVEYQIPFDTTRFVQVSIEEVLKTWARRCSWSCSWSICSCRASARP